MAGALVGGAFLAASLQVLIDKLASHGIGDYIWGRKLEEGWLVKKLTVTLLSVEAMLHDALKKRTLNSAVTEWLSELESTINEAQSLLNEIAAQGSNDKPRSRSSRSKAIREILERLEHMSRQKDVLDLIELSYILPTTSIQVHESDVVGRVDDKEGIVSILLSNHTADEDSIKAIGIVGVPGVGKTTLAQLVYNDNRVGEHFDLRVWVCLSSRTDVYSVTKTIFKAVTSAACDVDDLNLLQVRLREQLVGKKLLLVLDDVRGFEDCREWEVLRSPFRFCALGSCLIVTTRCENVAGTVRTLPLHHLNPLSDEDCWSLFSRDAFDVGCPAADPKLEAIGRDIVRKCRGLPIAAKTLGVLLWEKPDREEWDKILKDEAWDSLRNMTDILLKLRKGTKARKTVQKSRTEQATDRNLHVIGNNLVPLSRNSRSKKARLPLYCVLWLILLVIVFRMHPVLDDDQCREVFYNYVLGPFSMFPFLGGVTFPCRSLPNVPHEYIAETDIMNAIATSDTVISRPFHFKQCHHRLHFALIVPLDSVYRIFNSTREEHISAGSGYIATFFKFDCLVKHVLGQLDGNQTISVAVHDVTNSTEYFLLFDSGDYKSNQFHVYESRLELGDPFRKYKITCWYHQKASLSWIVISITCLTIVIGLLLGCILLGAAIHSLRIQELKAQVEAVNAASSSVLRAASGEIKMPANSILETLVLVLSTELRSPQKDYVRVAQEGCKRLIDLIDEVGGRQ
ncbi:putative disease resistance RPP13-like protein 1 isoform X3 [Punica granatum]|uniref:Disease resistance RPP13-like protein 1 isoform X3 n=1 Tax=Punica granatum TaxID=22663 RepID=A0A6P8E8E7_PUNGR|nr:putative disease resistance RPP13-like protein 1 isoform X3 [Punica granatum]